MDVADWLRQLGFERYEAAFRDNDVNPTVLPSLTGEDLKELGIASVGHRRQLLQAIAALRAGTTTLGDATQLASSQDGDLSANERALGTTAERRQLSVMFCDVMGFTALSSRLDPEDLSGVIRGRRERGGTAHGPG